MTVGIGSSGVPKKAVITEVHIRARKPYMGGTAPRDFRIYGSNDNKSWDRIFEHKGLLTRDYWNGGNRNSWGSYPFAQVKVPAEAVASQGRGYVYFRMAIGKITVGNNSGSIQIQELRYFGILEPDKSYEVDTDGVSPNKFLVLNTIRPRKYSEMTPLNNLGYFWPKLTLYNELRGNVDKNKYQLAIGGGYMGDEFLSVENLYWDGANAFAGYNTEMAQESFGGPGYQAGGGNASNAGAATFGAYDVYTETRWLNGYYEEECRKENCVVLLFGIKQDKECFTLNIIN